METTPQRSIWKQFCRDHWSSGEPNSPSLIYRIQLANVNSCQTFFLREKNSKIGSQIKITFTPISVLFFNSKIPTCCNNKSKRNIYVLISSSLKAFTFHTGKQQSAQYKETVVKKNQGVVVKSHQNDFRIVALTTQSKHVQRMQNSIRQ